MGKRPRVVVRVCILLVLGAIINFGVAWGYAFQEHPERTDGYYTNAGWGFIHWVQTGKVRRWYARYAFADVSWEERPDLSPHWASTSRELDEPAHERAMWVEDAAGSRARGMFETVWQPEPVFVFESWVEN